MLRTVAVILARLAWFMLIVASGVLLREPQLASSRAWLTLCIAGPLTFAVVFPRVVSRFTWRASTPRLRLVGWLALGEIALLAVAVTRAPARSRARRDARHARLRAERFQDRVTQRAVARALAHAGGVA